MVLMYTVSFASLSILNIFTFFVTEFDRWTGSDFLIVHLAAPFQDIKNPLVYFQILHWLFKTKPSKVFVVKFLMLSAVCRHCGLSNLLQVFWKECQSSGSFTQTYFTFTGFFPYLLFSGLSAHQLTRAQPCECALGTHSLSFLQTSYTLHNF